MCSDMRGGGWLIRGCLIGGPAGGGTAILTPGLGFIPLAIISFILDTASEEDSFYTLSDTGDL